MTKVNPREAAGATERVQMAPSSPGAGRGESPSTPARAARAAAGPQLGRLLAVNHFANSGFKGSGKLPRARQVRAGAGQGWGPLPHMGISAAWRNTGFVLIKLLH